MSGNTLTTSPVPLAETPHPNPTITPGVDPAQVHLGRTMLLGILPAGSVANLAYGARTLVTEFGDIKNPKTRLPYLGLGTQVAITEITPGKVLAAARISPLVIRVLQGEQVTPEEVQPYAADILRLKPMAHAASAIPGVRQMIHRRVSRTFPDIVRNAVASKRDKIAKGFAMAAPFAEVIAGFERPHEQITQELAVMTAHVHTVARQRRAAQIGNRADIDKHVTADDAAFAINHLAQTMLAPPEHHPAYLPMVRGLARTALSRFNISPNQASAKLQSFNPELPVVASEVVEILNELLPWKERNYTLMDSVRRRSPAKRHLAEMFYSKKIEAASAGVPAVLRGIRGLMPALGSDVPKILNRLQALLLPAPKSGQTATVQA